MILQPEHFAAVRINWDDKAANLRAIARELNVGIGSIALLDDNPVECEWIREQIPEVTVIELPAEPSLYAEIVRNAAVFERLQLTEEDQARGKFYADQRQRAALEQSATSLEDFYRTLQMRARVELVNERTLARAAQLTQKTNQFNLTTRRYSEQQMAEMIASPTWRAFTIEVTDRFGDNGIVGVAILRFADDACEIDTFLLSCRVIGRTIETAFLSTIAADAARQGAKKLTGWFIPTKKNAPSAGFYQQHGFTKTQTSEGAALWELVLAQKSIFCPLWIIVE
ncbi:MAG TPA: hypothetical protein VG274_04680, partial [Rhizomicrobium sp.]|nr:hypothetical protein [Rhizomicrobium sp.]